MTLDVKRGVLLTEAGRLNSHGTKDPDLGIHIRTLRLVSLGERAIGLQLIQFEIEEGEVEITLEASFEGVNSGSSPSSLIRISACGAPTVRANVSQSPRHRPCGSTVMIFRRPRAAH